MDGIRKSKFLHGLAAWLIALGLLWPSVQAMASSNDQLSWLICSSNPTFTVTTTQQQQLQRLEKLLGLNESDPADTGHACPYQGCFGAQGGAAVMHAPADVVSVHIWATSTRMPSIRGDAPVRAHIFSSQTSRAPPRQML
jgi:hypothetical protein